jgi:N-acetylglutamate synthase-like GNAT family acetyltransferase
VDRCDWPRAFAYDGRHAAAIKEHRFDLLYADGCLAAVIETVPKGDFLLIENVAVAPSLQGRGFGKRS